MTQASDLNEDSTWVNVEDFLECCRVCMCKRMNLRSIFCLENNQTLEELQFCTGILLSEEDGLPVSMCDTCLINLSIAYEFKKLCLHSDEILRKILERKIIKNDLIKKEIVSDTEYEERKNEMEGEDNLSEEEKCSIIIKAPSKPQRKKRIPNVKSVKKKVTKSDQAGNPVPDGYHILVCEPCNLKFTDKALLMAHKRNVHGCEWICEICGKQFKYRASHYSHMQSHLPPRYSCQQCDYRTWHNADMKKHIRIHTGEKKFICEHCTASFHNTSNLRGHFRRHHNGGVKTHACPRCDLAFYTTDKLRRHLDTHDNVKRFECDVCHAHFTRRCHWKRHLFKQHDVVVPKIRPGRQKVNIVKENMENKLAV